ncbi:RrF2 family transcriptional regulator [Bacteroidota bacterium]
MLRLSKKVEYGILALQYIAENPKKNVSAKEMSENLNISFEFLSKTLQKLMKSSLITSHKGLHGGYTMAKKAQEISVTDVITALSENSNIVACLDNEDNPVCDRDDNCSIRYNMIGLQKEINSVFAKMTIAEMVSSKLNKTEGFYG